MKDVTLEILETDKDRIFIRMPMMYKNLLETVSGRKYETRLQGWTVPLTWPCYVSLCNTFKDKFELGPNLYQWATETQQNLIRPALQLRDLPASEGYPDLYPHQNVDVRFLTLIRRGILASDLGSGKTRSVVASLKRLYETGENPFPALVVCPNSAKISWQREIDAVWPGLTVQVVRGTATQRKKQLTTPAHIYIMNWESVRSHSKLAGWGSTALKKCPECGGKDASITPAKCQAHPKELNAIDFNTVVIDEAHKMKDPSTLMARAVRAATGDAEFRFAVTGTPIANTPDDLWSILNWLYPESFPAKTKFIDRYLITSLNAFGATTVLGIQEHMKKELYAIIDPITRRMPKEVILPFLPPVVYEQRYVEMSPKQKKAYTQMSERMVAEIDDTLVVTTSPLVKLTRMLQLAVAYGEVEEEEYVDKDTGETKIRTTVTLAEPSAKLDAFMDDIEEFEGHHVVVFTPFKQLINLLAKRFDKAGIKYGRLTGDEDAVERQYHMDNFQDGKYQFILVTTAVGGASITLTKADIAVYLSRPWSNIDSQQSEGRIHRLGSEMHEKITYIDYITEGSVEEGIFQALDRKEENLQEILRDKEIIKKLIKDGKID